MNKTHLAGIWRQVNGSSRWPSDVDAFVDAMLEEIQQGEPACEIHPNHLKPGSDHWCREVLLYSGNSPHDWLNGENPRVKLYTCPQPDKRDQIIAKLIEALSFYADGKHDVILTGFKDGKRIDWDAERQKLSARGFTMSCELYNGSECYMENGSTAQKAIYLAMKEIDK